MSGRKPPLRARSNTFSTLTDWPLLRDTRKRSPTKTDNWDRAEINRGRARIEPLKKEERMAAEVLYLGRVALPLSIGHRQPMNPEGFYQELGFTVRRFVLKHDPDQRIRRCDPLVDKLAASFEKGSRLWVKE